jgi:hypothetical protein
VAERLSRHRFEVEPQRVQLSVARIADRPLTRRLHTKLAGQYRWAYGINAGANDKAQARV